MAATSSSIDVTILSRSNKNLGEYSLSSTSTLLDLKNLYNKSYSLYTPDRQYYKFNDAVLKNDDLLISYAKNNKLTVVFKDLGYQISWRTVFIIEYLGPLFIHPLLYYFPSIFYGSTSEKSLIQILAFYCVLLHFIKREYETIFIHRFSSETMPWFNIIKNSTHYWLLSGLSIAYFLYHPLYTSPSWLSNELLYVFVGLFLFAEYNNYSCHVILRDLRPLNSRVRGIPYGNIFNYVSCANYFWELLAWLIFSIFTQTLTSYIFFAVSAIQIYLWSIKKHVAYKKEFGDKYPRRKVLVPFLI